MLKLLRIAIVSLGLVVSGSVLQASSAAAPTATPAIGAMISDVGSIVADPGFHAFAAAAPTLVDGQFPQTGDLAVDRIGARLNSVLASPTYAQAVKDLSDTFTISSTRGIPEAIEHINRGNGFVIAAVNVFTVLVIPGILACPIGQAANCVPLWLSVGAWLAAGALINAAFEYVAAVLALAE